MKSVSLPSGERVPAFGLGTWSMGEHAAWRAEEIATLQLSVDLGAALIDTAEMYGDGAAEELVGEALGSRRDEVFIVSKVYPYNATRKGAIAACERSLNRLRTDRIDLYLLHWREASPPLAETMDAFMYLQRDGKIRHYGVSNFDVSDMVDLGSVPGGAAVATNQVLYNLAHRGPELDLLPWSRLHNIPTMAYSPIDHERLVRDRKLVEFARRYRVTPAQVALAWLLMKDDVIVIPKTKNRERLIENVAALELSLSPGQLSELERLFPAPARPVPLEMI